MIESQDVSPFHLSELAGALATIEACAGNIKKAKPLLNHALEKPAENALAQAAWLGRHIGGISWRPQPSTASMQSSEANAWSAFGDQKWATALQEALVWQGEQPFSSRPAVLGSYIAADVMCDYTEAVRIASEGLISNRFDAMLYNNLAFALANADDVDGARLALLRAGECPTNTRQAICLVATEGLVFFRMGQPEEGRALYNKAIDIATRAGHVDQVLLAKIHLIMEEMRIASDQEPLKKEGLDLAEKLNIPVASVFRRKFSGSQLPVNASTPSA